MVYPYAARSVHEDKKAAAQIVAGQAHMIAAKLCSQVFDPDEPLSKHPPLHLVRWAYIVRSAGDPVTQQVVESMLSRTKPGGELGDGDGVVNGVDLGHFNSLWGTDGSDGGDFNGDGIVDGGDLAILLGNWAY